MSIAKAVIEASELGLEPSGVLGHAYLVPYWNAKTRRNEAQLQVGYRGFIELAGRSGRLHSIFAEVVYDCDLFEYERGLHPVLRHKPTLNRPGDASPIAVYAVATFNDGGGTAQVLDLHDVERRRLSSQTERARAEGRLKTPTVWEEHWEEMAKKSAVRALAKYLPLSPELTRAAVADEYKEMAIDAEAFSIQEPVELEAEEPPAALPAAPEREPGQEG
jgi:recombination protein RecT